MRQSVALASRAGDHTGKANALNSLGIVEQKLGRHALADRCYQDALILYRRLGNSTGQAHALDNLGTEPA